MLETRVTGNALEGLQRKTTAHTDSGNKNEQKAGSKNLTQFVRSKLQGLEKVILASPDDYDREKVIREFRDLTQLVNLVSGQSTRPTPIVHKT